MSKELVPVHRPGDIDLWPLEAEGTSREILGFDLFRFYALSPSTHEVIYYLQRDLPPEMQANGPDKRSVWIELPRKLDPVFWAGLNNLAQQLDRRGILKPG